MHRNNVLDMIKRRALAAGLPETINCHTFRATGITAYLRERRHHRERPGDRGGPSDFRFGSQREGLNANQSATSGVSKKRGLVQKL